MQMAYYETVMSVFCTGLVPGRLQNLHDLRSNFFKMQPRFTRSATYVYSSSIPCSWRKF